MRLDESPELGYSLRAEKQSVNKKKKIALVDKRVIRTFERDIGRKLRDAGY